MDENLYNSLPEHYLQCYNDACELADTCLHRLAARLGNTKDVVVTVVNPRLNSGKSCRYYREKKTVRMAHGMLHTFDRVLAADITELRKAIVQHFGNGSYYRRRNDVLPIPPAEQEYISRLFRLFGYPDGATFDSYSDEIDW